MAAAKKLIPLGAHSGIDNKILDETSRRIAEIRAIRPRLIRLFIQEYFDLLPERGRYPDDPMLRWMVAGAAPMNHALAIGADHSSHSAGPPPVSR